LKKEGNTSKKKRFKEKIPIYACGREKRTVKKGRGGKRKGGELLILTKTKKVLN